MSLRPAPSKPDPLRLAQRVAGIEPFWVMECAKAADAIARTPACDPAQGGERMLYLNIGEPDETAPPAVVAAAQACLDAGRTQYTDAIGLPALRERISRWYAERFEVDVAPGRIIVTAGASAALQLACLVSHLLKEDGIDGLDAPFGIQGQGHHFAFQALLDLLQTG